MLADVPLAFTLDLDARAVDEQVQRAFRPPVGNIDIQRLLTAKQVAKIWYRPVEVNQLQQAFDEPSRRRSAMPNRTFIVRNVWMAVSLSVC